MSDFLAMIGAVLAFLAALAAYVAWLAILPTIGILWCLGLLP
jgi:hypothetical protein